MGASDITLKTENGIFNYRVGAIIVDSNEILMVKNDGSEFYYTVGGRIKFGESAHDAIIRESYEETQIHFEIDRLVYIHECFFILEGDGEPVHEISLFFKMMPNANVRRMASNTFTEDYGNVSFHWLPINDLGRYRLYPEFFKTELLLPSNEVGYYVTKNDKTIKI